MNLSPAQNVDYLLLSASQTDDLDKAKEAISLGASLFAYDANLETSLTVCARFNSPKVCAHLLSILGAPLLKETPHVFQDTLQRAALKRHLLILDECHHYAQLHIQQDNSLQSLYQDLLDKTLHGQCCARVFLDHGKNSTLGTQAILRMGANVHLVYGDKQRNLLHYAVEAVDPLLLKQLLDQGLPINHQDTDGNTAFHLLMAKRVLKDFDSTPVHEHSEEADHYVSCIKELIYGKADLSLLNHQNQSIIDKAKAMELKQPWSYRHLLSEWANYESFLLSQETADIATVTSKSTPRL